MNYCICEEIKLSNRANFLFVTCVLVAIQGCVAIQSFPTAARSGETITVAIGSQDGLTKDNIQLLFYPQGISTPIDLTPNIRSVLKIFPDKTSRAWINNMSTQLMNGFVGHGARQNILVIDLPQLPTGMGYLNVSFEPGVIKPNPSAIQDAEGFDIGIEILTGTSANNTFDYMMNPGNQAVGNLSILEPMPQVVMRYDFSPGYYNFQSGAKLSAAEYKIKVPISTDASTLTAEDIVVVFDERANYGNKQIQTSWSNEGDVVTVNIDMPANLNLFEATLRFSILIDSSNNGYQIDKTGTPVLISHRLFDKHGQEITPQYIPEVIFQGI